jgi:tRNA(Ile)-lysidine synthase TilS/MesJ
LKTKCGLVENLKNILKKIGINDKEHFLLALSGGIDSMVLCDLLLKNKCNFVIAHCNFTLRGEESNKDENFVLAYVKKTTLLLLLKGMIQTLMPKNIIYLYRNLPENLGIHTFKK